MKQTTLFEFQIEEERAGKTGHAEYFTFENMPAPTGSLITL